jgi:hypothetical protein
MSESAADSPAFRDAMRQPPCLIPAEGSTSGKKKCWGTPFWRLCAVLLNALRTVKMFLAEQW